MLVFKSWIHFYTLTLRNEEKISSLDFVTAILMCIPRCWFFLNIAPCCICILIFCQRGFASSNIFKFYFLFHIPVFCSWLIDFSPGKDFPFSWFFPLVPIKELFLSLFFNKYHSCTPICWLHIYADDSLQIGYLHFLSRHHDGQRDVCIHALSSYMKINSYYSQRK